MGLRKVRLRAKSCRANRHTFAATWHFPNNHAGDALGEGKTAQRGACDRIEGHYYENFFADSAEVGACRNMNGRHSPAAMKLPKAMGQAVEP